MSDINYVCARWRDAGTCPPQIGWVGLCRRPDGDYYTGSGVKYYSGDQWLDITDEPAVPRAQVQAAVDEMITPTSSPITPASRRRRRKTMNKIIVLPVVRVLMAAAGLLLIAAGIALKLWGVEGT